MSGLGALVKVGKAARKAEPFYSAVDEAAQALTRGKGTGKEFMIEVLKKPGVKPTEIKERGLQKIEAMPKMTKEQFLDELEKRPAPQVEEKVLREPSQKDIEDRAHELAYDEAFDELRAEGMNRHEATDIAAEMADDRVDDYLERAAEDLSESGEGPYHGNYAIAGGENYREMLLKMPRFKGETKLKELEAMRRRVDPDTNPYRHQELTKQIDALKTEKAAMPEQFQGLKQHFGGEPGILASIRVSDRIMPTYTKQQAQEIGQRIADGMGVADHKNLGNGAMQQAVAKGLVTPKEAAQYADFRKFQGVDTTGAKQKVLHVEEIQSDWHQQGRKQGYKTPEIEARRKELEELAAPYMDGSRAMPPELRKEIESLPPMTSMPDAPFKKNWHELAMKRVLNYAAENGYDRVAITPGAEQASRYNLAKQVDSIAWQKQPDNTFSIQAIKGGDELVSKNGLSADQLEDMIGKDAASKIHEKSGDYHMGTLQGVDLEVGGEGMKGFYDKMLPDYLNSYGKKYGVQVTPFDIVTHPEVSTPQIAAPGIGHFPDPIVEPAKTAPVHGFEITPQMREEITGKGLPLYQQIGIPAGGAAAGIGALEQEDQGFAVGGPVGSSYDTAPDMSDGGRAIQGAAFKNGGRVHLSQNPDTMLLDLMSRS
jgi:hypothetical protein